MRFMIKGLVVASAGFALLATPAVAADYQDEMREMRDLVLQLQGQVQTQQEQINVQQDVLQDAGLENERGSASMMASFLSSTDFSGHVATSYIYNTNEPEAGADGGGASGFSLRSSFQEIMRASAPSFSARSIKRLASASPPPFSASFERRM